MATSKHDKASKERSRCRNCGVTNSLTNEACRRCGFGMIVHASQKCHRPSSPNDSAGESDGAQDTSPSVSERWDSGDSTESSSTDESDHSDEPSGTSGENKLSRRRARRRKHVRPANFIRINQRPMMEMKPGSNIWFQARIVKERATEVLITFPGVTEDEDSTLELVPKTSTRIWYGDYKTRAWKYLGKGSWRPKATNKRKAPPRPYASKSAVSKNAAEPVLRRQPASSSEKVASAGSEDSARDTRTRHRKDALSDTDVAAQGEVCKRTESHDMSSSRAGHQVSRANQQEIGSKLARSPDSGSIQAEPDPLADWFSVHFQNLTENAMFEDHPAGYSQMENCLSVEQMCSHDSATSTNPTTLPADRDPPETGISRPSDTTLLNDLSTRTGELEDEQAKPEQPARQLQPHGKDVLRINQLASGSSARPRDMRRAASTEPVRVSSTPSARAASAEPLDRRNSGHDWQPPKELCHLLDGMFEIRPRVARAQSDEKSAVCEHTDTLRFADSTGMHQPKSKDKSELRTHQPDTCTAAQPGPSKIQYHHPAQTRLRGRVLLSDSDDDSDDDLQRRTQVKPLKKARTHP
ncbi:uncharacterized protein LOC142355164 isoform X2 [Convolutriloba macropyga]|uniref:uncharacterized protein LOC142355164 isoform X2 n=1 Tax=Convolutriloba macropyga TaxID=536237 RepID=UPI003F51CCDF